MLESSIADSSGSGSSCTENVSGLSAQSQVVNNFPVRTCNGSGNINHSSMTKTLRSPVGGQNLSSILEENERWQNINGVNSSFTEDGSSVVGEEVRRGLITEDNPPSDNFIDIMHEDFKIRKDRDSLGIKGHNHSWLRRFFAAFSPDLTFSLSTYKGGGMFGPPHSVAQIFCTKDEGSKPVEVMPTQWPSDTFENSLGVANAQGVYELDPSLQQISKRMQEILKAIEGRCRMPAVRLLGYLLGRLFRLLFTGVEVDTAGVRRVRHDLTKAASCGASVMLLPTHRSHIDYLLMSYVCFGFNLPTPHIAAGDNLNIPVMGLLFSYSGAFFLRRSFRGDNLYKKVLYGYLLRKLREGVPIEVFVEGGRSRTGMVSDPKLGMLVMAVRFVRDGSVPDIMLLPSSIDYERALETDEHVNQQLGSKKHGESLWGVLKSGWKLITGLRFGQAYVNFATGVSIKEILDQLEKPFANNLNSGTGSPNNGNYSYIPEEVCVQAVADAVVAAQRCASFISPTALLAAALLACEEEIATSVDGQQEEQQRLAILVMLLAKLVAHAGARTVDVARIETNPVELRSMLAASFETLMPLLEVSITSSISRGKQKDRKERNCNTSATTTEKVIFAAASATNDAVEATAKQRLRLRYCCGQLVPVMAPYGCVATALSTLNRSQVYVTLDELCTAAASVAEMVLHSFPGSRLDAATLRACARDLIAADALEELRQGVHPSKTTQAADLLRCLRVLVAPAISACCATLTAMSMLSNNGRQTTPVEEADLMRHTRQLVLAQCRRESIGGVRQWDIQHQQRKQQQQQQHNGWALDHTDDREIHDYLQQEELANVVGFPEVLSTIELTKAVQNLTAMSMLAKGVQQAHVSRTNSTGSMSSLQAQYQHKGMDQAQPLHAGGGDLSDDGKRITSMSQFSVISVASSVSFYALGDAECVLSEGGSTEGSTEVKSNAEDACSNGCCNEEEDNHTSGSESPTNSVLSAGVSPSANSETQEKEHQRKGFGFDASTSASASVSAAQASSNFKGNMLISLAPLYMRPDCTLLLEKLVALQRYAFRGDNSVLGHVALAEKAKAFHRLLSAEIRMGEETISPLGLLSLKTLGATLLASGVLIRMLHTWKTRFKV